MIGQVANKVRPATQGSKEIVLSPGGRAVSIHRSEGVSLSLSKLHPHVRGEFVLYADTRDWSVEVNGLSSHGTNLIFYVSVGNRLLVRHGREGIASFSCDRVSATNVTLTPIPLPGFSA